MKKLLVCILFISLSSLAHATECIHKQVAGSVTNFPIYLTHEKTIPKGGCLVVNANTMVKPKSGKKMIQITVKPNTCSSDSGFSDCTTDRSRVEFYDGKGVKSGRTVTYEYSMFIPKETNLKQNGTPTVFLGQLNTTADSHYSSPIMITWSDYSGIEFQIYDDFNWQVSRIVRVNDIIPPSDQKGNWLDVKYEVTVYADKRGKIIISLNGKNVYQRLNHPTIKNGGKVKLKMGIYNYKVSQMKPPRTDQVVYFDKISRRVKQHW